MTIRGGNPPMRPDQTLQSISQAGSGPAAQQNVFGRIVIIISGPTGGLFVYSPTAGTGNLIESVAAANGTDPYGNAYFKGTATYSPSAGVARVITLLSTANNAFFQYANPSGGVQGALISSLSSVAGTDPVTGQAYLAGFYGIDPAFGDTIQVAGANINLNQVPYTRSADVVARVGSGSANPFIKVDAPEQGTAGHMQQLWQGTSPDGTQLGQAVVGLVSGATVLTPVTNAMFEVQGGAGQAVSNFVADTAGRIAMGTRAAADVFARWITHADGAQSWGPGTATQDTGLSRQAANLLQVTTADFDVATAGRGLRVSEGANGKQGTATLVAGTVTVANTSTTASSRIGPWAQDNNTTGALRISARTAGTSFTITSSNAADTGVVAFEMFEPG